MLLELIIYFFPHQNIRKQHCTTRECETSRSIKLQPPTHQEEPFILLTMRTTIPSFSHHRHSFSIAKDATISLPKTSIQSHTSISHANINQVLSTNSQQSKTPSQPVSHPTCQPVKHQGYRKPNSQPEHTQPASQDTPSQPASHQGNQRLATVQTAPGAGR